MEDKQKQLKIREKKIMCFDRIIHNSHFAYLLKTFETLTKFVFVIRLEIDGIGTVATSDVGPVFGAAGVSPYKYGTYKS